MRHPEWANLAERLKNYKALRKEEAKKKGEEILKAFMNARTLTEARKIMRGEIKVGK